MDLATVNYNSGNVSVLRNNGNGTFLPKTDYAAGTNPSSILAADLDADGDIDLATANYSSNNVSVLLKQRQRHFPAQNRFQGRKHTKCISAADYDRDGDIDLVVTNQNSGKITVLFNRDWHEDILVSPMELSYGYVKVDSTKRLAFKVYNFGVDSILHITNIQSSNPVFTTGITSASILPGDSLLVTVDFTPVSMISYTDSITFNSSDPDDVRIKIELTGSGYYPVINHSPTQNQLNVQKNTDITVVFSADMVSSSINAGTFRVNASRTGLHTGTFSYNSGTKTLTFNPDTDFDPGEQVSVVLTTGIAYAAGGTLPVPFQWSFNVEVPAGSGAFIPPKTGYMTGSSPYAVSSADLDKDLDVDLVVANSSSGNISVLLNTGNGTFSPKTDFAVTSPYALFPADLDADGDVDLAGANYSNGRVFVMLNNGNGSFQAPVYYYIGDYPYSVHAADLDADGDIDLVAANNYNISVLFNNGSGTFQNITNYTAGTTPYSVYAADLDADGDIDLATANRNSNNVSVLRNNGNGTFQAKTDYTVGTNPYSVYAADLDADGDVDLATVNYNSGNVSVLRNNGNGTFLPKTDYAAGTNPSSILAADLDADGDIDLATANYSSNNVSVLRNNGNGTFLPKTDVKAGSRPGWVSAADYDRDGDIDLAVTNQNSNRVSVLLNRNIEADILVFPGELSYGPQQVDSTKILRFTLYNYGVDSTLRIAGITSSHPDFTPGITSATILPGDSVMVAVNFTPSAQQQYTDSLVILSSDPDEPSVKVYLTGSGYKPIESHAPTQNQLNVQKNTDITVVFSADMVSSSINAGTFRVNASRTGLHTGTFSYNSGTKTLTFNPDADFDPGEQVSVVLTTGIAYAAGGTLPVPFQWSFNVEVPAGSGAFIPPKTGYMTGSSPYAVSSADLDKDLDVDLVVANSSSGNISVLLNTGNGTFGPKTDFAVTSPYALFPADLDADGDMDLAGTNCSNNRVFVMLNNGNGSFQAPVYYYIGDYPYSVHAADLDADGDIDLVAANNYNISVLFNNGSGTFQNITNYTAGSNPQSVFAADLDADGDIDLATANRKFQQRFGAAKQRQRHLSAQNRLHRRH